MKVCLHCGASFATTNWQCPMCGGIPGNIAGFTAFAPELAADAGFRDVYFNELVALESRNFWFRARNRLIRWVLERYFAEAGNFLEIGCGTGFVLFGLAAAFPHLRLSGSEISATGLNHAALRVPGVQLFQMDARAIPFLSEFDVIGVFDVLEHIEEDEVVLRQIYQALRPGGGLLLTVPQHEFLWSQMDEHACHVRRYNAGELMGKVTDAGFEVLRMTSFVSLLLPLMIASRSRQRVTRAKYDVLSELRIGKFSNAVLEKILDLERLAIRAGFDFPAGGSLLLVARKVNIL